MTYDGVPGGFAFIADGGMVPTIGLGTPDALLGGGASESTGCTTVVVAGAVVAAGAGGGGLGSAQAAAKTPTAITLSQVCVTSASLPDRSNNT